MFILIADQGPRAVRAADALVSSPSPVVVDERTQLIGAVSSLLAKVNLPLGALLCFHFCVFPFKFCVHFCCAPKLMPGVVCQDWSKKR